MSPSQSRNPSSASAHWQALMPVTRNSRASADSSESSTNLRDGIDPGAPLTAKGRLKRNREDENLSQAEDDTPALQLSYKAGPKFPFKQASYHIRRAFDLYGDLHKVINDGVKRQARIEAGEEYTSVQSDRDYETFNLILDHISGLREEILRVSKDPIEFRLLVRKIKDAASSARNNDTAGLKKDLPLFLLSDGSSPIPMKKGANQTACSKSNRGFYNDVIGRFLCPINLDWDDPSVRQAIRDGKVPITAHVFPRLLYADCKYNDADIEDGLGKNQALLRVVKYIFTGRSSAFSETPGGKTTRAGNGEIAGLKQISPRIIAYGACMLRFSLSSEESWKIMDAEFNMQQFYWNIVKIFENSGDFGTELLSWWNQAVLGVSNAVTQGPEDDEKEDSLKKLEAQRAAKRARILTPQDTNQIQTSNSAWNETHSHGEDATPQQVVSPNFPSQS